MAHPASPVQQPPAVYVLHFDRPYFHASHYVGWCADGDPQRRLREHLSGQGSPLVRAAVAAGITVELVLSTPGDRYLERKWHNRHGSRVCPRCFHPAPAPAGRQLRLPIRVARKPPGRGHERPHPAHFARPRVYRATRKAA
jgi:hypothetical protein